LSGCDYSDALTWLGANAHRANDRFRAWRYNAQVHPRSWHGIPVAHQRRSHEVEELHESYVVGTLGGIARTYERLSGIYYPGGPRGSLPPGWMTVPERLVRNELDTRRRQIAEADDPMEPDTAAMLQETWETRRAGCRVLSVHLPPVTPGVVMDAVAHADTSMADAPTMRIWPCGDLLPPAAPGPVAEDAMPPGA
jgi:hypothetical protein